MSRTKKRTKIIVAREKTRKAAEAKLRKYITPGHRHIEKSGDKWVGYTLI